MSLDRSAQQASPRTAIAMGMSIIVLVVLIGALALLPAGRRLPGRFVGSLREPAVQAVNVNLNGFVGPEANQSVQQLISQMISSNVTSLVSEKPQSVRDAAQARQLAGFRVQLLGARADAPELRVNGRHTLKITIDRARLQSILKEAGRSDLIVPTSLDGASVLLQLPRSVRARYGDCPQPTSAAANVATPPPNSIQYASCLLLIEGPRPQMSTPPGFDLAPLAQIGLEAAGMTTSQAQQFLRSVNWQSLLGVAIPRSLRSYATVEVDGVHGTLFDMAARRGPTYTLIWVKDGIVYSLVGYGDPLAAVKLAGNLI